MSLVSELRFRMRALLGRRAMDAAMEEELRFHFEKEVEKHRRGGASEEEARRRARLAFGGHSQVAEACRQARGVGAVESVLQDVRYALRQMKKSPGFAAAGVLTLALGIGANTAVCGLVNGLLFRSMHIHDESRVTEVGYREQGGGWGRELSWPEYQAVQRGARVVFAAVIAEEYSMDGLSLSGHAPVRAFTDYVTGNYFEALGVRPELGRLFQGGEGVTPGADAEVVLSYRYWKEHFGGDPGIVGRRVAVNDHPMTVVGVVAKDFTGINALLGGEIYLPLAMRGPVEGLPASEFDRERNRNLWVYARLGPGIAAERANAALGVVARQLEAGHPQSEKGAAMRTFSLMAARASGDLEGAGGLEAIAALFMGLSGMVLLLACVNVGNLVLVRASVREREMAMRSALGAGRWRLVRQMLTESVVLALLGGAGGVGLGAWGSWLLSGVNLHTDFPVRLNVGPDWHVLAYSVAIGLGAGGLVSLAPVLRLRRTDLNGILREGGRGVAGGRTRFRDTLVAVEIGSALVLLIVAGLFTRSLQQAERVPLGFNPSHVLTAMMDVSEIGYQGEQTRDFYTVLLERVRALPGVTAAATADSIPFGVVNGSSERVVVSGGSPRPGEQPPLVPTTIVGGDYFRTLETPLLRGRAFTAADDARSPAVAVVSEAMAKRFWPQEEAVGKRFTVASRPGHPILVVGIAGDARYEDPAANAGPRFYVPFLQHFEKHATEAVEVRTAGDAAAMAAELEQAVRALAPTLPVFEVKTLRQSLSSVNGLLLYEVVAALAGVMGGLGLVLAMVGVYGVLSYVVQQKTGEIGVRMALGARPGDVLRMVYRQGLWIVGMGLAGGLGVSLVLAHFVRSMLEVSPADGVTYVGVSALLTATALLACWVPARRAMLVDPMQALRSE